MSRLHIDLIDESGANLAINETVLAQLLDHACADAGIDHAALTILLVDRSTSDDLHQTHFGVAGETDVMTFPDGSTDPLTNRTQLDDLAVCPQVAIDVAADRGRRAEEEVLLYALHGLLHLLDYDDTTDAERNRMWAAQRRLLAMVDMTLDEP